MLSIFKRIQNFALWQTYLSDPASITMEGILIFNKHLLFLLALIFLLSVLIVSCIFYSTIDIKKFKRWVVKKTFLIIKHLLQFLIFYAMAYPIVTFGFGSSIVACCAPELVRAANLHPLLLEYGHELKLEDYFEQTLAGSNLRNCQLAVSNPKDYLVGIHTTRGNWWFLLDGLYIDSYPDAESDEEFAVPIRSIRFTGQAAADKNRSLEFDLPLEDMPTSHFEVRKIDEESV